MLKKTAVLTCDIDVRIMSVRHVPVLYRNGSTYHHNVFTTLYCTLLSVSGKVFAHILLARIQPLLDKCCRPQQSGFTAGRSTMDASLEIVGRVTPKF